MTVQRRQQVRYVRQPSCAPVRCRSSGLGKPANCLSNTSKIDVCFNPKRQEVSTHVHPYLTALFATCVHAQSLHRSLFAPLRSPPLPTATRQICREACRCLPATSWNGGGVGFSEGSTVQERLSRRVHARAAVQQRCRSPLFPLSRALSLLCSAFFLSFFSLPIFPLSTLRSVELCAGRDLWFATSCYTNA